jgi:hypothetical protein
LPHLLTLTISLCMGLLMMLAFLRSARSGSD